MMKIRKHTPLIRLFFSIGMLPLTLLSTRAYSQAPFYQGKTVTVIASTSPAGTGDLRVKALLPFLRKHIPGNPTLVLEYMDGGGGRKAANYLFRNARPDGLTIGAMSSGVISLNIMRESGVLYDLDKFIYLGAPETAGHQTWTKQSRKASSEIRPAHRRPNRRSRLLHRRAIFRLLYRVQRSEVYRRLHRSRG
jgi:tripartite-type tricarboxylate transporter receptor subunit TctC